MTDGRTGLPVTRALAGSTPFNPGKPQAITLTRGLKKRLARPITAFCSCRIVGILRSQAARSGGTVGYPPNPTTARGLMPLSFSAAAARPAPKVSDARALAMEPDAVVVADGKAWMARAGKSAPNLSA